MHVPTTIHPYLFYDDVPDAIAFLTRAFGFVEQMRTATPRGGMHAQLTLDDQLVMLGQGAGEKLHRSPRSVGAATSGVFVYLADVDAHYARARAAGAEILDSPADLSYGRSYTAIDPQGQRWFFTTPPAG